MTKRLKFQIPVGDWAADGHGRCDWFDATADGTIEEVYAALARGSRSLPPGLRPASLYDRSDDGPSPKVIDDILTQSGIDLDFERSDVDDPAKELAAYMIWVINLGNSELCARLSTSTAVKLMPDYAYGYGVFMH